MTTRSVTVNVEKEEEVVICDDCGLSNDAGQLIEFKPESGSESLHFHESCIPNTGANGDEGVRYPSVASRATDYDVSVALAVGNFDVGLIVSGVGFAIAGISWSGVFVTPLLTVLGAILILMAVSRSRLTAKKSAEELRKR